METLEKCLHSSNEDSAIIVTGKTPAIISHVALAKNVQRLQRTLATQGVGRGTKVSIVLSPPHLFTVAFLALTMQSALAAPLNHGLKLPEFEEYLKDFGSELVILFKEEVDKQGAAFKAAKQAGLKIAACSVEDDEVRLQFLDAESNQGPTEREPNKPNPEDIILVLGTSGTTGKPKRVPLSHGNISRSISNIIQHYSLSASDRAPVIMLLFHIHGLVAGIFAPLASGGAVIFAPQGGLAPSFFRDAVAHKATWYTGAPTLHRLASQIPMKESPNFQFVRSCSSRLEGSLLRQLEEKYGCPIVEAYAMTEAAHQVCSNPVDASKTREESVGMPTGIEVQICDEEGNTVKQGDVGEVCIKGSNVMKGYLDNDEANAKSFTAAGFFRTGDQGKLSEDGYLALTGRLKEMINKGGEKMSPVEIDNVMNQHPDIAEAVVFAMPDEMYGEDIGAAVIVKPDTELKEADLKKWIGERLLQAKVPKKVFFVEKIPKTPVARCREDWWRRKCWSKIR